MKQVKVGWDGLKGALHGLDEAPMAIQRAMGRSIRSSTREARNAVKARAPRKGRAPHGVTKGVKQRVKGGGIDTVGRVYLSGIAIPVARGPKRHEIEPKQRRALKLPRGFAMRVTHPGAAPNPFFDRGVDDAMPAIERELDVAGLDVLSTITRAIDADKGAPR